MCVCCKRNFDLTNVRVYAGSKNKTGLKQQLFVSGPGNVPNTERKRPSEETGTMQATGPRQVC